MVSGTCWTLLSAITRKNHLRFDQIGTFVKTHCFDSSQMHRRLFSYCLWATSDDGRKECGVGFGPDPVLRA
jgi:hypothetical protein